MTYLNNLQLINVNQTMRSKSKMHAKLIKKMKIKKNAKISIKLTEFLIGPPP